MNKKSTKQISSRCKQTREKLPELCFGELKNFVSEEIHLHLIGCEACMQEYLELNETLDSCRGQISSADLKLNESQRNTILEAASAVSLDEQRREEILQQAAAAEKEQQQKLRKVEKNAEKALKTPKVIFYKNPRFLLYAGTGLAACFVAALMLPSLGKERSMGRFGMAGYDDTVAYEKSEIVSVSTPAEEAIEEEAMILEYYKSSQPIPDSHKLHAGDTSRAPKKARKSGGESASRYVIANKNKPAVYDELPPPESIAPEETITSDPVSTSVASPDAPDEVGAIDDVSDDAPSTNDNSQTDLVCDVKAMPNALASASVFGGRPSKGRKEAQAERDSEVADLDMFGDGDGRPPKPEGRRGALRTYGGGTGDPLESSKWPAREGKKDNASGGLANAGGTLTFAFKGEEDIKDVNKVINSLKKQSYDFESSTAQLKDVSIRKALPQSELSQADIVKNEELRRQSPELNKKLAEIDRLAAAKKQAYVDAVDSRGVKARNRAAQTAQDKAIQLMSLKRYTESIAALDEVLVNDPFNSDAARMKRRAEIKLQDAGIDRRTATRLDRMAEIEWKWRSRLRRSDDSAADETKKGGKRVNDLKEIGLVTGESLHLDRSEAAGKELTKSMLEENKELRRQQLNLEANLAANDKAEKLKVEKQKAEKQKAEKQKAEKQKEEKQKASKKNLEKDAEEERLAEEKFLRETKKFVSTAANDTSTFSIDVDTASYTAARALLARGQRPQANKIRIEEFLNAFEYHYLPPQEGKAFAVSSELSAHPVHADRQLLRVGVQAEHIGLNSNSAGNYVLLIDNSGSMAAANRLPAIQKALPKLQKQLNPEDRITLMTFEGGQAKVLARGKASSIDFNNAVNRIEAGRETNLAEGLDSAYKELASHYRPQAFNRLILLSDGLAADDNTEPLMQKVENYRRQGLMNSVIGVGARNYNDGLLEQLANRGDGSFLFASGEEELEKIFTSQFSAMARTVARDVKIQLQMNKDVVKSYRLIGYENRRMKNADFRNDTKDAGEVGSGQSVTALYELKLQPGITKGDTGTVRIRYKRGRNKLAEEEAFSLPLQQQKLTKAEMTPAQKLSYTVKAFAELLRNSGSSSVSLEQLQVNCKQLRKHYSHDQRLAELEEMIRQARRLY